MIVSRTPFRLPLGGGGTDLPFYYTKYGGFFISGAVDKYMHIVVNDRFEPGIRVSYSQTEIVDDRSSIRHPLVREALKMLNFEERIEIVSLADVPASTGLGSSGSFTVGLLNALYAHQRIVKTPGADRGGRMRHRPEQAPRALGEAGRIRGEPGRAQVLRDRQTWQGDGQGAEDLGRHPLGARVRHHDVLHGDQEERKPRSSASSRRGSPKTTTRSRRCTASRR